MQIPRKLLRLALILIPLVILSILTFEFSLRLTGHGAYKIPDWHFITSNPLLKGKKHLFYQINLRNLQIDPSETILIVGDNFTSPPRLSTENTYPYYLSKILEYRKFPANIKVFSSPFMTTMEAHKKIIDFVTKGPLKIIIWQVGAMDIPSAILNKHEEYEKDALDIDISSPFFESRLMKYYENYKTRPLLITPQINVSSIRTVLENLTLSSKNQKLSLSALEMGIKTIHDLVRANQCADAFQLLLELMEIDPIRFWSAQELLFFRTQMILLHEQQNRFTNIEITEKLKLIKRRWPALEQLEGFKKYMHFILHRKSFLQNIDADRKLSWDHFFKAMGKNKIPIILLNYPQLYVTTNSYLKGISFSKNFPLLDNERDFAYFSMGPQRMFYIEDAESLTPNGYQGMANILYGLIKGAQ